MTKSEPVPGLEPDTKPTTIVELRLAPNSSLEPDYQSAYESNGEPESTSESSSIAEPESRNDGCDHFSRTMNKVC